LIRLLAVNSGLITLIGFIKDLLNNGIFAFKGHFCDKKPVQANNSENTVDIT